MDYLTISNLPIFWILAGITVIVSAVQTVLYVRQANKATRECQLDPQLPKQAFKIGLISAIGPACGVFIVMVGLMSAIGGPIAWLRLSIIGAAATELSAACSIGIFGYLNANSMVKAGSLAVGPAIAILTGALSMMAIGRFIVPKHPKLAEYSLGIAMIVGIACAIVYESIAA